jgi:hypothetical protein
LSTCGALCVPHILRLLCCPLHPWPLLIRLGGCCRDSHGLGGLYSLLVALVWWVFCLIACVLLPIGSYWSPPARLLSALCFPVAADLCWQRSFVILPSCPGHGPLCCALCLFRPSRLALWPGKATGEPPGSRQDDSRAGAGGCCCTMRRHSCTVDILVARHEFASWQVVHST